MALLDIKRVKMYMDELGYDRDEAISLVKAEMNEDTNAIKDFNKQTETKKEEKKEEPEYVTKADLEQLLAKKEAEKKEIKEEKPETMEEILKRLV